MNFLPKIKTCPNCNGINFLIVNGKSYDNYFQSLIEWNLKKVFNCRKCSIELGLFINKDNKKEEKLVWVDYFKCEDSFYNILTKLQNSKLKYKKFNKKYNETLEEIRVIQNQIRKNQIKIKIKYKIQNRRLVGHVH
jgi:hypothetical protein